MFGFTVMFLCMVGLSSACVIDDPSIALNPGLSQHTRLTYESKAEEQLFKALRTKNSDIAHISSHRNFLHTCRSINVVPRGSQGRAPQRRFNRRSSHTHEAAHT